MYGFRPQILNPEWFVASNTETLQPQGHHLMDGKEVAQEIVEASGGFRAEG